MANIKLSAEDFFRTDEMWDADEGRLVHDVWFLGVYMGRAVDEYEVRAHSEAVVKHLWKSVGGCPTKE